MLWTSVQIVAATKSAFVCHQVTSCLFPSYQLFIVELIVVKMVCLLTYLVITFYVGGCMLTINDQLF